MLSIETTKDPATLGALWQNLASHWSCHAPDSALSAYEHAIEYYIESGQNHKAGMAYIRLAIFQSRIGEVKLAEKSLQQGSNIFDQNNDLEGQLRIILRRGDICRKQEAYNQALEFYARSSTMAKEHQFDSIYYEVLNREAVVYSERGELDFAVSRYLELMDHYEMNLDLLKSVEIRNNLAGLFIRNHDFEKAKTELTKGLINIEKVSKDNKKKPDKLRAKLQTNLATVLTKIKRPDEALKVLSKVEQFYITESLQGELAGVYINFGLIHGGLNNIDSSEYYFELGLEIAEQKNISYIVTTAKIGLAQLYLESDRVQEGIDVLLEILPHTQTTGNRSQQERICFFLTKAFEVQGEFEKALRYQRLQAELQNSLQGSDLRGRIIELETKYEVENKEGAIRDLTKDKAVQSLEARKSELFYSSLIIGLLCTICLAMVLLLLLRQKMNTRKILASKDSEISRQRIEELEKTRRIVTMGAMLEGQEMERKRISTDLHDEMGSLLTTLRLNVEALEQRSNADKNQVLFEKVTHLLDQIYSSLRRISHNMMPAALSRFGWKQALIDLCESINGAGQMEVHLDWLGMKVNPIPENVEINIFRIIQELVTNAVKHSKASNLTIQLSCHFHQEQGHLNITVEDDGVGFDPQNPVKPEGIGLKNLKARVDYLNGTLKIFSEPGSGTSITIDCIIPEFKPDGPHQLTMDELPE